MRGSATLRCFPDFKGVWNRLFYFVSKYARLFVTLWCFVAVQRLTVVKKLREQVCATFRDIMVVCALEVDLRSNANEAVRPECDESCDPGTQ